MMGILTSEDHAQRAAANKAKTTLNAETAVIIYLNQSNKSGHLALSSTCETIASRLILPQGLCMTENGQTFEERKWAHELQVEEGKWNYELKREDAKRTLIVINGGAAIAVLTAA